MLFSGELLADKVTYFYVYFHDGGSELEQD